MPEADAGGDGERRRRQHDGQRRSEGPMSPRAAARRGPTSASATDPQPRRPDQADAAAEDERQRRGGDEQPHEGDRATGPTAKRTSSPQPGAVAPAMGRPKMEMDARPARTVPTTHGAARSSATATDSSATTTSRQPGSRSPTTSAPTAQASAVSTTTGTIAGAKLAADRDDGAEDGDLARPGDCASPVPARRRRVPRSAARARRSAMKGKAA